MICITLTYYFYYIITWYQVEMFPYLWSCLSNVHHHISQLFFSLLILCLSHNLVVELSKLSNWMKDFLKQQGCLKHRMSSVTWYYWFDTKSDTMYWNSALHRSETEASPISAVNKTILGIEQLSQVCLHLPWPPGQAPGAGFWRRRCQRISG